MAISLLSAVLQNLNSLIQEEVGLLWGVHKEMKKLSSTLSTIQAVLEDAELKQMQHKDKAIQDWLQKLKDATYKLDDILDDCSTKPLRWESEGQRSGYLKKVSTCLLYPFENIKSRHKIAYRMNEIKERLDAIADERTKFHLREVVVDKQVELAQSRETSSFPSQRELYGRYEDKEKIIKHLVEDVYARYTVMKEIPSSIGSMKHLRRLPKKMKYLRSLRHLCLSSYYGLIEMPPKLGQLNCLKTLTMFVVDKSSSCPLAELQSLNLGGELCIKHLERVRNPMDAKEVNLVAKQNLRRLELFWEDNAEFESQEHVEQLLESLEPHPNIKGLVIHHYKGSLFPLWMRESSLQNAVEIKLKDCKNCSQLPPFGKLPFLKRLEISGMDKVKYIDDDFPGEGPVRGFPSLEVLNICSLPNLKGLSREEGRELLPRLREMEIGNCPNLRFPCLLSLINLKVWGKCTSIVLTSISNLQSLNILKVVENEEVICFPIEVLINLTRLESLQIESFTELRVFPEALARLVALKSLYIRECPKLESLPEEGLQGLESLQFLEINDCKELSTLSDGLRHLTALEKLYFIECPNLLTLPECIKHLNSLQIWSTRSPGKKFVSLPEALQHVHSLQSLYIASCPELTSLPEWLGNLTLLRSLNISNCPKVSSLPASMQSLTKLQKLYSTQSSPELARRCEKGKGADWYKIAHVPEVSVFPL
ncbi:hypothetical protein Acr_25g0007570 [Actinidia rufa]|uniref:Rx N-terminal domain-containing protein n=1 Tax=Actinidia rufa TaxID=165716 RepID=A0A7J0H047_9ERIC|nr:hypothetical protein Acr_25g0007570 [Actinidia rufa]